MPGTFGRSDQPLIKKSLCCLVSGYFFDPPMPKCTMSGYYSSMTVSFTPGDWASIESLFQAGNSHVLVQFIGGGLSDTMTLTTIDNGSVRNMGSVGVPCSQFMNVNSLDIKFHIPISVISWRIVCDEGCLSCCHACVNCHLLIPIR